jgi:uncharacterized membrane protein
MIVALVIKLVHIFGGIGLISGLIGRGITLWKAQRTADIHVVVHFTQLAGWFERWLVVPSSWVILLFGLIAALLNGWPLLGFLQGAQANWLLVSLVLFLSVIPVIIFIFLPRGRVFGRALEDALRQGSVTPTLQAAFADRLVAIAHVYELVVVFLIMVLMIAKPF